MIKYKCECKSAKCEVEREDTVYPQYCTCFCAKKAYWQEVKAEKLPSWCKVGELVYFTQTSDYGEVVEVDIEKGVTIKTDICNGWVNFYDLQEARIRPFNESEMRELVGKAITSKITETSYLIVRSDQYCVSAAGDLYCNERLLELFTFTNGQPCGVYEHLENGEWVE